MISNRQYVLIDNTIFGIIQFCDNKLERDFQISDVNVKHIIKTVTLNGTSILNRNNVFRYQHASDVVITLWNLTNQSDCKSRTIISFFI